VPQAIGPTAGGYTSHFITAQDGLKLHVRSYGSRTARGLPVVCLSGLSRTSADFHPLATALSSDAKNPRHVIAMDYRGRGRSDYDPNPANYSFTVELADLIAVLTALDIGPAIFVGTSRGGILTMLLATVRPTAIAGVVLNDIGPVIEAQGLVRIKSYVGKLPQPKSFAEGGEMLRGLFGGHFPKLTPEDWTAFAQRTFVERRGKLVPSYDPSLANTLQDVDIEHPLPPLWKEFDALAAVPMTVVRGANSDILSSATVQAMRERRGNIEVVEIADQGHAPLLVEDEIIRRIGAFVASCEAAARR
jgi:pimeloyl-ACP methyl ester carboxylesterase